ncbi:hypothetical protein, partial [Mycoplasma nasistruthionis]|uniref:hypothetical protein n=1 Tax=Mycoplasma nasistruthionis TaxID=353852 RepID=UPI001ABFE6C6
MDLSDPDIQSVDTLKAYLSEKKFTYTRRLRLGGLRKDQYEAFVSEIDTSSNGKTGDDLKRTLSSIKTKIDEKFKLMTRWYDIFLSNSLGDPFWETDFQGYDGATINRVWIKRVPKLPGGLYPKDTAHTRKGLEEAGKVAREFLNIHLRYEDEDKSRTNVSRANIEEEFVKALNDFRPKFKAQIFPDEAETDRQKVLNKIEYIQSYNWNLDTSDTTNDELFSKTGAIGHWLLAYLGTKPDAGWVGAANHLPDADIAFLKKGVDFFKGEPLKVFIEFFGPLENDQYKQSDRYKNLQAINSEYVTKVKESADLWKQILIYTASPLSTNLGEHQFGGFQQGKIRNFATSYAGSANANDPWIWRDIAGKNVYTFNGKKAADKALEDEKNSLINEIRTQLTFLPNSAQEISSIQSTNLITDIRTKKQVLIKINAKEKLKSKIEEIKRYKNGADTQKVYNDANPANKSNIEKLLQEAENLYAQNPNQDAVNYDSLTNQLISEFPNVQEAKVIEYNKEVLKNTVDNIALSSENKEKLKEKITSTPISNYTELTTYKGQFEDLKRKSEDVNNLQTFDQHTKDETQKRLIEAPRDNNDKGEIFTLASNK